MNPHGNRSYRDGTTTLSQSSPLAFEPSPQAGLNGAGNMEMRSLPAVAKADRSEQQLVEVDLGTSSAEEPEYPAAWKLAIITIALCMAIFLVALVSHFQCPCRGSCFTNHCSGRIPP